MTIDHDSGVHEFQGEELYFKVEYQIKTITYDGDNDTPPSQEVEIEWELLEAIDPGGSSWHIDAKLILKYCEEIDSELESKFA